MNSIRFLAASFVALALFCSMAAPAREQDTAGELGKQIRTLSARVRSLESEQHQLLVRKALASSDSKYLELDLRRGQGLLKYRTRILRSFRFRVRGRMQERGDGSGVLSMTSKSGGSTGRKRMSWGDEQVIIAGWNVRSRLPSVNLSLRKRDLRALFHVLEIGSIALLDDPALAGRGHALSGPGGAMQQREDNGVQATATSATSTSGEEWGREARSNAAAVR